MHRLGIAVLAALLALPGLAQEDEPALYRDESWVHIGDDRFAPDSDAADDLSLRSGGAVLELRIALDEAGVRAVADPRWKSAVLSGEAIGNDSARIPSATPTYISLGATEIGRIERSGKFEFRFDKALLATTPDSRVVFRVASGINGPTDRDDQEIGYFRLRLSAEEPPAAAGAAGPPAERARRHVSLPAEPKVGSYALWGTRGPDGSASLVRWAVVGRAGDSWVVEETRYGDALPEIVFSYQVGAEGKVEKAWCGLPGRVGRATSIAGEAEEAFESAREYPGESADVPAGERTYSATRVDITYRSPDDESVVRTERAWYSTEAPALGSEKGAREDGTDLGYLVLVESTAEGRTTYRSLAGQGEEGATSHLSLAEEE